MKILYIITQADGGGAQKYVLSLAQHFGGAIAAGNEAEGLFDAAHKLGLETFQLKHLKRNIYPWHDLLATWEIRELIKNFNPDIVHLNSSKAGALGSFAAIGLKKKVVFTAHGFIFNEPMSWIKKSFYLAVEKTACDFRDYIICVSEADKQSALKNNLIDKNKISVIHNGISQMEFLTKEQAKKSLGLPMDKKIIGAIANNYETKGLDVLKKAVTAFPIPGTLTAIIGKTGGDLQSDQNIKDFGYKENAYKYLKAFDILVIPSRKEGLSYVALESLQAGVPAVATDVGGNREALGEAGQFVDSENPEALSQASSNLLTDDNLHAELSKKALQRAKLFTEEKMLAETKKIYELLLKS